MSATRAMEVLERERLLAIVRLDAGAAAAAEGLRSGGMRAIEFSMAGDDALPALRACATRGHEDLLVGAGTVLTVRQAEAAVDAGAAFLLAPTFNTLILAWASANDVLYVPGAFTPSEILAAREAGAQMIKLFPAARLGPGYVQDLLGPLPGLRILPTGGINHDNLSSFLDAGAVAVALGSSLVEPGLGPEALRHRARQAVDKVRQHSARARRAEPAGSGTKRLATTWPGRRAQGSGGAGS